MCICALNQTIQNAVFSFGTLRYWKADDLMMSFDT